MKKPSRRKGAGGPRTRRGRARVRLNPVKHGVLAQTPVLPLVEKQEDWDRLIAGLYEYWRPDGMMQAVLVDQIAWSVWRRYRVFRFESEAIEAYLNDVPRDWRRARASAGLPVPEEVTPEAVDEMNRMLMLRLLPGDETIEKIMRYDSQLHRFLLQTIHQLLILKGLRFDANHSYNTVSPAGMIGGRKAPRTLPRNDWVPKLPPGSLGTENERQS